MIHRADDSAFTARFNACTEPKEVLKIAEPLGAAQTASLLYADQSVNATLLGKCLGSHLSFFKELVRHYPQQFDFAGTPVVTALRHYLWRFRLPGESAQIERILEGFASAFFSANKTGGKTEGKNPLSGWYARQPSGVRCCIGCGATEDKGCGEKQWLSECQGCGVITFCRPCRRKLGVSQGHAIGGRLGYGRACVAAQRARGLLSADGSEPFSYTDAYGRRVCVKVDPAAESLAWERASPFLTEDSVMVLCYAIIMLTTNLHSDKVKQKMKKHEFLWQNKGVNNELNFPGDFLSDVYDDIASQELQVIKPGA